MHRAEMGLADAYENASKVMVENMPVSRRWRRGSQPLSASASRNGAAGDGAAHLAVVTLGVDDLGPRLRLLPGDGGSCATTSSPMASPSSRWAVLILALVARARSSPATQACSPAASGAAKGPGIPKASCRATFSGVALAYNTLSEVEVHQVMEQVEKAGRPSGQARPARLLGRRPGAISRTPKANLWEVAHNPDFPIRRRRPHLAAGLRLDWAPRFRHRKDNEPR